MSDSQAKDLFAVLSGRLSEAVTDGTAPLTGEKLLRQAMVVSALLPEPTPGSEVAFAFGFDRASFAAALLGVWLRGHRAALPINSKRDNVVPVFSRPQNVGFLHDTGVGLGHFVPRVLGEAGSPDPAGELPAGWPRPPETLLFRTGASEPSKTFALAEIEAVLDTWEGRLALPPGALVSDTHTPSTWPGLLLGLLLPLRAGGRFEALRREGPLAAGTHCLVAPASRIRAASRAEESPAQVVSVGQPTDTKTTATLTELGVERVDFGPLEIDEPVASWRAQARPLREALLAEASVLDVAMIAVPTSEETGPRKILVAIAADEDQHESLSAKVASEVVESVEFTARFFAELPRDENGILQPERFFLLFGLGRRGNEVTRLLEWERLDLDQDAPTECRFRTTVPENYLFFDGHFPTYPVMAGAVQLQELVLPCIRSAWPEATFLERARTLKFLDRVQPGDEIDLKLKSTTLGRNVSFELLRGETRCSIGQLVFADPEPAAAE